MEFIGFDSIIGYIAAFASLCLGLSLFGHVRRERTHIVLGFLLFSMAFAFILRSTYWINGTSWMLSGAYFFFALLPLLMALFVENLLGKALPTLFKMIILAGLVLFTTTCWYYPIRTLAIWKTAHMGYHIFAFVVVLSQLFLCGQKDQFNKQEWHVYKSIIYCMSLGLVLVVLEWLYALGPMEGERVRLSAFALIIFVHNLVNIYFNEHEFSFRKEIISLSTFFIFSGIAARVLVKGGFVVGPFPMMVALLFATAITFSTLNLQIISGFSGSSMSRRILDLVRINKNSEALFLKDLNEIAEFKNLTLIQPHIVEARHCESVYEIMKQNEVLSLDKIDRLLLDSELSPNERDSYLAARFLLLSCGVRAMALTRKNGPLLAATPIALRSTRYFENLLLWSAQNYAMIEKAQSSQKPQERKEFPIQPEVQI